MKKIFILLIGFVMMSCSTVQYATIYTTIENIDYFADEQGEIHQHIMLADGASFVRKDHYFIKEDIGSDFMYEIPVTGKYAQTISTEPVIKLVILEEAYMYKGCRYASFFVEYNDGFTESKTLAISVNDYTQLENQLNNCSEENCNGVSIPLEEYSEICSYNPQD